MTHRVSPYSPVLLFAAILYFLFPVPASSQTTNPRWITDFPAPERVIKEIRGTDEQNAIERQMGAFKHLLEMIDSMAYGLERRSLQFPNKVTPDEYRLKETYGKAFADLWYKAKNRDAWANYVHDGDLWAEMMSKLFSKTFQDLYRRSDSNTAVAMEQHRKQSSGVVMGEAADTEVKPGSTAEMRKCVESGRSMRVCFAEVSSNGMEQITGFNLNLPIPPGPRMTGDYGTAQGMRLIFQPHAVTLVCRGIQESRDYEVELTDAQTRINVAGGSAPIGLSLRPDGKITGSGPVSVTGTVVTGSHTENVQAYGPAGEIIYGQRQVIHVQPKTVNCNLGLFNVIGSTPLPPNLGNPFEYLGTIFSGMNVMAKGGDTKAALKEMLGIDKAPAPGIRLNGVYASATGLSLAFHPESVTLVCGDAEQAVEYSVQRTLAQTLLRLSTSNGPLDLVRKPNGSFSGTGNVQVNGRRVVGSTGNPDNPFKFAPVVNRCDFGTLDLDTNPTGSGTSAAARKGDLGIATNFEGHPLIGKPILLFKESLESLLRKQGFQPSNAVPRKTAIQLYADACKAKDPKCEAANQALSKMVVVMLPTNAIGRADFSGLPVGDYWIVTAIGSKGRSYLWNLHVEITTDGIATSLDERNTIIDW